MLSKSLMEQAFEGLLVDLVAEVGLELHRKMCSGKQCLSCQSSELCAVEGCDVFGRPISHQTPTEFFPCLNCGQRIASSRFAPHLEKCMGKGGRAASRSRSAVARLESFAVEVSDEEDDANDSYTPAVRMGNASSTGNFEFGQSTTSANAATQKRQRRDSNVVITEVFLQAVEENAKRGAGELNHLFASNCCAINVKNGKMCANPLGRCGVHSDYERELARERLIEGVHRNVVSVIVFLF
jgi:hypothetical protein